MFQRLLVCTDLTDHLQRLIQFTPSLAATGIEHMTVLHNVPIWESGGIPRVDAEKVEQARQRFAAICTEHPPEISVQIEVQSGRALEVILQTARDFQSDLILLGISQRSLLTETLFGSTTTGLYQRTTVPLMILRPPLMAVYTSEELDLRCRHLFRHLLLPYDGSAAAQAVVERVKRLVQEHPRPSLEDCHLCWVIEDVGRRDVPRDYQVQAAEEKLAGVKAILDPLNLRVETEVRLGSPVVEVLEAACNRDISAIALSSNPRTNLLERSLPSFTAELLRRSWHPVIYFPPSWSGSGQR